MASGKSLEKAEELVNKLFYVPAYTADDLESRDDNDERVISIATALDEARSEGIAIKDKEWRLRFASNTEYQLGWIEAIEGCIKRIGQIEFEYTNVVTELSKLKEKPNAD